MIIELEMLQQSSVSAGLPRGLKTLLEHLIISHHGHYEFGSPKLPMFPERLLLHYMDDLDSKMESMRAHLERDADSPNAWAGYNPSLGRNLLNTAKFLAEPAASGEETRDRRQHRSWTLNLPNLPPRRFSWRGSFKHLRHAGLLPIRVPHLRLLWHV